MSSAYKVKSEVGERGTAEIEFIYMINKRGPMMDP